MIQSNITHYFKKEVQPTADSTINHYFKKEIDIDWDEADNCYDQCSRCKKNFKHDGSLRTHKFYCGKERNLQCAHCSYKTKYKISLTVHLSKVHQNGKKNCQKKHDDDGKIAKFCQKCNKTSEALVPSKCEKCFSKLLYQCSVCAKLFKTRSLSAYHWSTRCGVKGYSDCIKCDFKSVWRSKVAQHMKKMHQSPNSRQEFENIQWTSLNKDVPKPKFNTYKCPKCAKLMGNSDLLARHVRVCGGIKREGNSGNECENNSDDHQDSEAIKCSTCGERFDHIYSLNVHVRNCQREYVTKITNESDVEVVETAEEYTSKSIISADKRYAKYIEMIVRYCSKCHEESPVEEKSWGVGSKVPCRKCKTTLLFKCKKCLREYDKYKSLKVHLDTVCNPTEKYKCTKCNYKAHKAGLVKTHHDSVHGTANAECQRCGKIFKSNDYLKRHLRKCGVEPKFQCEHCPFKSKLKIYLRQHIFRTHMEPVVVDRKDMIKMSRQRFTRAASHLTAHCSKCKNEQRLGHRLKTCRKCKTKLYYKCKVCKTKYDVDDEHICGHVKAYLETIKFECKRCGRGMISEKSLWMHESTCGAKASFKCRFCKYTSNFKGNTATHEKGKHPHKFGL